jgi:hypothetical protein
MSFWRSTSLHPEKKIEKLILAEIREINNTQRKSKGEG